MENYSRKILERQMAETGKAEDEHKGDGEEVTINLTGFPPCFSRTEKSAAKDGKGKRSG